MCSNGNPTGVKNHTNDSTPHEGNKQYPEWQKPLRKAQRAAHAKQMQDAANELALSALYVADLLEALNLPRKSFVVDEGVIQIDHYEFEYDGDGALLVVHTDELPGDRSAVSAVVGIKKASADCEQLEWAISIEDARHYLADCLDEVDNEFAIILDENRWHNRLRRWIKRLLRRSR